MDVSVIIVNYKTTGLVEACIRSVIKQTEGVTYEIIVVDNNSGDGCGAMLARCFPHDRIVFVGLDDNPGFGIANNKGMDIAQGRYVFCLNPDTLLINNAIKELVSYLDTHEEAGACGGNLYDGDMRPAHSFYRMLPSVIWELNVLAFRKIEKIIYRGCVDFNHTGHPVSVGYVTGADLMVRRSIMQELEGFSPDFFMYYEETDLCCRIRKSGYSVMSVPAAMIQHLEGKSFGQDKDAVCERRIRMMEQGRLVYYMRNTGAVHRCVANAIYRMSLFLNMAAFRCLRRNIWRVYRCRMAMFAELVKTGVTLKS